MLIVDGVLGASKSTLHECRQRGGERIDHLSYVNFSGSDVTVNLYTKVAGGTSRSIIAKDLVLPAGAHGYLERPVYLWYEDSVEGDASSAASVSYVIHGVLLGNP